MLSITYWWGEYQFASPALLPYFCYGCCRIHAFGSCRTAHWLS